MADDTRILETINQPLSAEPPESEIPAAEESRERDVFDSEKESIEYKFFMSKMVDFSRLFDKDYMNAFDNFDLDKQNFELALGISFKSDHLLIPKEHRESVDLLSLRGHA